MVTTMANLLKKYGLTVSSEVVTLDMSRYQSSSQEILFLQDLYVALSAKNAIVLVENFEEASPIYNRMMSELVMEGKCVLSKRYNLVNNQLQEATSIRGIFIAFPFQLDNSAIIKLSALPFTRNNSIDLPYAIVSSNQKSIQIYPGC